MRILSRLFTEQRGLYASQEDDAARLLDVGETRSPAGLPSPDLAAMTTVVSANMNLDEFVAPRIDRALPARAQHLSGDIVP